jgi:hypothetical protein
MYMWCCHVSPLHPGGGGRPVVILGWAVADGHQVGGSAPQAPGLVKGDTNTDGLLGARVCR